MRPRIVRHYDKAASGVIRPRLFRGDGENDYVHRKMLLSIGRDLVREHGILIAPGIWHTPNTATWDQQSAEDHREACQALDRTPAGKRAKELLFSLLTPSQRRTAEQAHYFDVWLYNRHVTEEDLKWERPVRFDPIQFRFRRFFPNGNIKLGYPEERGFRYSLCLHPITPYPTDDIVLAQMISLLTDPDEFIRDANVCDLRTGTYTNYGSLFGRPRPKKLYVP